MAVQYEHVSANAFDGTDISSHASANTKGSWTQLIAATSFAASSLVIQINRSTGVRSFLVDIGIDTGGGDTVLIPNCMVACGDDGGQYGYRVRLPVTIPSGAQVLARCQDNIGGSAVNVSCHIIAGAFDDGITAASHTDYGTSTGNSRGTQIDPGATPNTKPATYTELVTSTTNAMKLALIQIANINQSPVLAAWALDIATGAGGSESIIIPDLIVEQSVAGTGGDMFQPSCVLLPVDVPAGTRLSARAACSTGDATDRLITVSIIGIDATVTGALAGPISRGVIAR